MKYAFIKGVFVAACATAFAACSADDTTDNAPAAAGKIEVSFGASLPDSRAQISVDETAGHFTGAWEETDQMTIFAKEGTAAEQHSAFTFNEEAGKVFTGTLTATAQKQDWTYQAIYPAVADATTAAIPFGAVRTQKGNNFNSAYDPLVSATVEYGNSEPGKTDKGEAVTFDLKRLTSILALTFTSDLAEKVKSVTLTAEGKTIAAQSFVIVRTNQTGALNADTNWQSNKIVLTYDEGTEPAANVEGGFKAYFNVPADTYGTLTAVITTEGHVSDPIVLTDGTTLAAGELAYTTKTVTGWTVPAAPTVEWVGHEDKLHPDGSYDKEKIKQPMDVQVNLQAAAGIKGFVIEINSEFIAQTIPDVAGPNIPVEGNITTLDLVDNPAAIAFLKSLEGMEDLPYPVADYSQPINLVLGGLIDMLDKQKGDHVFTLTLTDNLGRKLKRTLTFFYAPDPTAAFSADLWTNSATVTLKNIPAEANTVSFAYRKNGTAEWNEVAVENKTTAQIAVKTTKHTAATWMTPNAVKPYSRLDTSTGIFAGQKYDYKITVDGTEYTSTYTASRAPAAQAIPDGDMEYGDLLCFYNNDQDERTSDFWNSGNNSMTQKLCMQEDFLGDMRAKCQSSYQGINLGLTKVGALATGNLFTGNFKYSNMKATVSFGQVLPWKARPSAMHVSYHAKVGDVNQSQGNEVKIAKGNKDYARIFVCIVDWTERHDVTSGPKLSAFGNATLEGNWDPETPEDDITHDNIIAYGSLWINKDSAPDKMDEAVIDLNYYDLTTKPTSGNYSVVISCACSAYGDYFNGCDTNTLYVDDFEWVY